MDNKDIDDILLAVNGANRIENNTPLFNMLHRSPISRLNKEPVIQSQFKSFDPVNSVSSSDSTSPPVTLVDVVNSMDTSKITNNMNMKQFLNQINDQKSNPNPNPNPDPKLNSIPSDQVSNLVTNGPSFFSIMGYSIPESTLYFIIVLIIIGIALYFLTSDGKKEKVIDKEKEK